MQEDEVCACRPALLLLPAMGVAAGYYRPLVEQLMQRGYAVTLADFSSTAKAKAPTPRGGYAEIVEDRIRTEFRTAAAMTPTGCVVLLGHSLGGQLGLVFAGRFEPDLPVILIGSGSASFDSFAAPRRWFYLIASQVIAGLATVLRSWPGDKLGFGGRQTAHTMRDWASNVRTGHYGSGHATFDYQAALKGFRGPLAVVDIAGDVLAPPLATSRLVESTGAKVMRRTTYSPQRARRKPGAHFTWVRDTPGVVPQITEWLSDPRFTAHCTHENGECQ